MKLTFYSDSYVSATKKIMLISEIKTNQIHGSIFIDALRYNALSEFK